MMPSTGSHDNPAWQAIQLTMTNDYTQQLLNAQAELQTALGFYRLEHGRGDDIERCMQASLALQHALLADMGLPMYHAAELPEGWTPA